MTSKNNDLISRSALLDELQEELDFDTPMLDEEQNKLINTGLRIAVKDVKRQPTVDAVEVVRCEQCLYRSQYANEEGLYKCGAITCKEGHCAMVAPHFSCIAGKKRGRDDGTSQA